MSELWGKVQRAHAAGGAQEVVRRAMIRTRQGLHGEYHGPLEGLQGVVLQVDIRAEDALRGLAALNGWTPPSGDELSAWRTEARMILDAFGGEEVAGFGPEFDLGPEGATLLYCLVRWRRPRHVVETGVARGVSTMVVLNALQRTGSGSLTSFDVDEKAGGLIVVRPANWNFHVLHQHDSIRELRDSLVPGEVVSMFIHDSDHSAEHQRAEFAIATQTLEPGGLLYSDDVNASPAFFELLRKLKLPGIVLMDDGKAVGVAVLGSEEP